MFVQWYYAKNLKKQKYLSHASSMHEIYHLVGESKLTNIEKNKKNGSHLGGIGCSVALKHGKENMPCKTKS